MWAVVATIIAGIIVLAAISHHVLRHYLTPPTKSQTNKPQSQDKNQDKAGCTEQETMMSDFDGLMLLLSAIAIIAGIIGLATISLRLLRRCLSSIKSQTYKSPSWDKNHSKAGYTEQEAMISNSDVNNVLDVLCTLFKLFQESFCHEKEVLHLQDGMFNSNDTLFEESFCDEKKAVHFQFQGGTSNSNAFDDSEWTIRVLGDVMEALADPNTHLIGVYGSLDEIKDALLQKVHRRVRRDQQFGMVVTATITKNPEVRKIQEDIAHQLGFTFNQKSNAKRAKELIRRIKNEQTILIVLHDLHKRLELSKVGIPYGADHTGCKILLTSTTEDVLSEHMHTQKNIMVI